MFLESYPICGNQTQCSCLCFWFSIFLLFLIKASLLNGSSSQHEQKSGVKKALKTAAHLHIHKFCINQWKSFSCPTQNSVCSSIVLETGSGRKAPPLYFPLLPGVTMTSVTSLEMQGIVGNDLWTLAHGDARAKPFTKQCVYARVGPKRLGGFLNREWDV